MESAIVFWVLASLLGTMAVLGLLSALDDKDGGW